RQGRDPVRQTGHRSRAAVTRSTERRPGYARAAPTVGRAARAARQATRRPGRFGVLPWPILSRPTGRVPCSARTLSSTASTIPPPVRSTLLSGWGTGGPTRRSRRGSLDLNVVETVEGRSYQYTAPDDCA